MQLSWICRLICVALCSAGLLLFVTESLAWVAAPLLLPRTNARRGERSLFLLALSARLVPWFVVLGALLPAYMRGEDNLSAERVGLFCLAGAGLLSAWSVFCGLRVLRAWLDTRRCCRRCAEAGESPNGLPLLLYPSERPLLAVAGIFRSRILVSRGLLASGRLSAASMDVALLHESAHALHHDNLKLLVLSLFPHIPLATPGRPSLVQLWRLAAEMAADDEASRGLADRSILLAELLVSMARDTAAPIAHGAFGLLSRTEDLRVRVDRLLGHVSSEAAGRTAPAWRLDLPASCAFVAGILMLATLCLLCVWQGHHSAEVLLHVASAATRQTHELT